MVGAPTGTGEALILIGTRPIDDVVSQKPNEAVTGRNSIRTRCPQGILIVYRPIRHRFIGQ